MLRMSKKAISCLSVCIDEIDHIMLQIVVKCCIVPYDEGKYQSVESIFTLWNFPPPFSKNFNLKQDIRFSGHVFCLSGGRTRFKTFYHNQ